MFTYTSKNGKFTVYEGNTAFYLVDNETSQEACLGDGVDMFYRDEDGSIPVGTKAFYKALSGMIEIGQAELLEAYFSAE